MSGGSAGSLTRLRDRFSIHGDRAEDVTFEVRHVDLLEPTVMWTFLENYGESMGASDQHVTASRWSYHLMHPLLKGVLTASYALGVHLALHPRRLLYQHHEAGKPGYEWGLQTEIHGGSPDAPLSWTVRIRTLRRVMEDLLGPMFRALSTVSDLPERVLVENVEHVLTLFLARHRDGPLALSALKEDLRVLEGTGGGPDVLTSSLREAMVRACGRSKDPSWTRTTCCLNLHLERACERCPLSRSDARG